MAIRFRKSMKLAPGVRMNLSGSGVSWTVGPRGASVGIGKRGTFLNTGIPGTGLYARQALSSGTAQRSAAPRSSTTVELTVIVEDDGTLTFRDQDGHPVPEDLITRAKQQQGEAIKALITRACEGVNSRVKVLGELHHETPPPNRPPRYQAGTFDTPQPRTPAPRVPGMVEGLFKSKRAAIEEENAQAERRYQQALADWYTQKSTFETEEKRKQDLVTSALSGAVPAMEELLGAVLQDIVWPRETAVSFEVQDGGTRLAFDVDLPEVEDMPTQTATAPARGYKLSLKAISQTAVQKLYAQHIHSIAFRLIGEAFGMLPTLQQVTLSGYSQRKDKTTGHEQDDYLLSVAVTRAEWEKLNFSALPKLDMVAALERLGVKREMSKSGVFKAIQPL